MAPDGSFVVVWEDDSNNNNVYQIYAAGFNANGTKKPFGDIAVNENWRGQQLKPDVAVDTHGNFVVVRQDDLDKNGYYEVLARGFGRDGE